MMKRRQFIHTLATFGALSTPVALSATNHSSHLSALATPELIAFLGDHNTIHRIGLVYRERFPEENRAEALVQTLLHEYSFEQSPASAIDEAVLRDFANGDTVLLDGWLLSRTEARQAALYSLLTP